MINIYSGHINSFIKRRSHYYITKKRRYTNITWKHVFGNKEENKRSFTFITYIATKFN